MKKNECKAMAPYSKRNCQRALGHKGMHKINAVQQSGPITWEPEEVAK
jgi:hypothetical protein